MFHIKRFALTTSVIFMLVVLPACNLGQSAEATPTFDPNSVQTLVAATVVSAQQTADAAAPAATATLAPSETPTEQPSNTPDTSGPTATTGSALETPNIAPSQTTSLGDLTATVIATFTPIGGSGGTGTGGGTSGSGGGPTCKNASFVGDITIPDGTVMKPWQKFTKAWSIKNTGTCVWDEGFHFAAWAGPPSMTAHPYYIQVKKDFVEAGGSVNLYIDMYAPGDPGEYVAHWTWFDDNNKQFGGDFTVVIKVVK